MLNQEVDHSLEYIKQGLNMDIESLRHIIKSNLISLGLLPKQIEEITEQMLADIIKLMRES